jgi:hypothetical protein
MTKSTTPEQRWTEVARRADNEAALTASPIRTGHLGVAIGSTLGVIAAALVGYSAVFVPGTGANSWGNVVRSAIISESGLVNVLIIACVFVGIVSLAMSRSKLWRPIGGALAFAERRDVQHQISGENLVNEKRLPLIVMMAKQHHKAISGLSPLLAAAVLVSVRWAVISDSTTVHYVSVGVSVVLLAVGVWMLIVYLRADSFIANHGHVVYRPTQSTPNSDGEPEIVNPDER